MVVLCWLLIGLTPGCWWATALVARALRRAPEVGALRVQLIYFALTAFAASCLAIIAGNYLIGNPLPRGAGFVLLVLALVGMSLPLHVFLVDQYRRR